MKNAIQGFGRAGLQPRRPNHKLLKVLGRALRRGFSPALSERQDTQRPEAVTFDL